jgi:putative iron-regulated protein
MKTTFNFLWMRMNMGAKSAPFIYGSRAAMKRFWKVAVLGMASIGCGSDGDDGADSKLRSQAVAQYVAIVRANYADNLEAVKALQKSIDTFLDAPSAAKLNAAREAWIEAREPYGPSEAFRFYDGPIDDPDNGPEGQINAWPLDEAFIDGVIDAPDAGIINAVKDFPEITKDVLTSENEHGGEDKIATGFHAVEFLLWGQDLSDDGPGDRPYTDFLTGDDATLPNGDRRSTYLKVVTDLLVADLERVSEAWNDDEDSYATSFEEDPDASLKKLLAGIEFLAAEELSGERMQVAYTNMSQEDEHSCFSDNTYADLLGNAQGIGNVYYGKYGSLDGVGIDELVKKADPELAEAIDTKISDMLSAMEDVPNPFDKGLVDQTERKKIKTASDAVFALGEELSKVSAALGLKR